MPTFDIVHAQGTPDIARQPRANLNVDTGGQVLGNAIAHFGGTAFEFGQKLYERESAAEYSEMKRQIDEAGFATFNAATGDDEADAKLWQDFENKIGNLQSKKANVNAAVKQHVNEVMPNWKDTFYKKNLAIRQKNAHDKFVFEYDNSLSLGDIGGAEKILNMQLVTKDITEQEYMSRKATMQGDSVIMRARKTLDTDPNLAVAMLSEPGFRKGLNPEQLDKADRIQSVAERQAKSNSDAAEINIMEAMHKGRKLVPDDRFKEGEKMIAQLPKSGISPERYGVMLNRIEDWQDGVDIKSDRLTYNTIRTEILMAKSKTEDLATMRGKIYENTEKLSTDDFSDLMRLIDSKMSRMQADALTVVTQKYKDENSAPGYPAPNTAEFQIALEQWIEENPKVGRTEILQKANEMMVDWSIKTPEELSEEMGTTLPLIATEEDRAALPSGTEYIDVNGTKRRKR